MQSNKWYVIASSLTILGLLLASCAPAAAPTPTSRPTTAPSKAETPPAKPTTSGVPSPTPKPAAEQPRYGGSLALPSHSDPPNLDIHRNTTITLTSLTGMIYNGLVQYDQGNKVVPDLAESWQASPDGKVYTFFLRKGVKWHDGRPFTSADAQFSLEKILTYEGLMYFIEAIDKMESPDENTLRLTLKQRQSGFMPLLGHGRILIGPKHVIEAKKDLKQDAIGTGPFKLKQYLSGISFEVEKNKEYFVKERPYLDKVTFFFIKDVATRFAAFRSGRVQIFGHPPIYGELGRTHVETLKGQMPQANVRSYELMRVYGLLPNWDKAPWSDVRVRRAAFLVVDREAGVNVVSEGVGDVAISVFYGQWALAKEELTRMPGFRKPKDGDIAEAKRLLAEAGYPKGFKSVVSVRAGVAIMEKAATFMSNQLSKIGIDLTLQVMEFSVWSDARNKRTYDTQLVELPLPLDEPDLAGRYFSRRLGALFAGGDDDKILELIAKQSQAATTEERKEILFEVQRRVAEAVPHIAIAWQNSFIAFWPEVKNYTAQNGIYSHNKLEEVWLAK